MDEGKQKTQAELRRVLRECARLLADCDALLAKLTRLADAPASKPAVRPARPRPKTPRRRRPAD